MRRFFVKNILFVIAVNLLIKPVWALFIDRSVQNSVKAGAYGTYQVFISVSIIFQIVLDFGITNYNTRTIAQSPGKLKTLFPAMLSARLVLILVYMLLAFVIALAFGYRGAELLLLGGVLTIQSLNSMVAFIRSNIAALQKFKTDGLLSVTDRFLMIVVCGFLLLYPPTARQFRIEWFVATQICCYFAAAAIGYFVLRRLASVPLRFTFDARAILGIMRQSFPYALLIFLMSVYTRSDAIIMERLLPDGKAQADIWAAAFRLIDQANMIGLMFATVLLSLFGRMLAEKQDVGPIVRLCVNLLLPFSFMVAVAGIFFSDDIMHLLYKASRTNYEYGVVFAWLIASFPAWCLMYIYSTLLTANGSLRILNRIAIFGVVINLALNFLLVPHMKAVGSAITSFVTQTTLSFAFIFYASRVASLPLNIKWIASLVGYLLLVVALAFGIILLMDKQWWVIQLFTFGGICVTLMFVFRFISIAGIKQLMEKRSAHPAGPAS